ncbi:MAG: hypothetical protein ABI680_06560 [Chthoniobacteraceae bacterium]
MNAKQRFFLTIFLVAGAGCGFLLGVAVFRHPASERATKAADPMAPKLDQASNRTSDSNSDEEALGAVFSVLLEPDPLRRGWATKRAVEQLDGTQLAVLMERLVVDAAFDTQPLLKSLMLRWVKIAPDAAMKWARPVFARHVAGEGSDTAVAYDPREAAFLAWCEADPQRALSLALTRPDSEMSCEMVRAAMGATENGNPSVQLERALAFPDGRVKTEALSVVLWEWAKTDPAAALARLEALNLPADSQGPVLAAILSEWAGKDGAAALAEIARRMSSSEIGPGPAIYRRAIEEAAANDPAAGLALAETAGNDFALAVLRGWARSDPIAALQWGYSAGLDLHPETNPRLNGLGDTVLSRALAADSEKTVAWLRSLPPSPDRARLLASALNSMEVDTARAVFAELPSDTQIHAAPAIGWKVMKLGINEAVAWSRSIDDESVRSRVISEIVEAGGGNVAERLDAAIAKFPPGTGRDAALRGAVNAIAGETDRAMNYASQISDPNMREEAVRRVVSRWLYRDAAAARAWLADTSELSPEVKAAEVRKVTQ